MANPRRYTWPTTFDATDVLRLTVNAVTADVSMAAGTYRWVCDGGVADIAEAFKTMLETHAQSAIWTVTLNNDGSVSYTHSINGQVDFLLNHANTTMEVELGWDDSGVVSSGGAGTPADFTSDYLGVGLWVPYPDYNIWDGLIDDRDILSWDMGHHRGVAADGEVALYDVLAMHRGEYSAVHGSRVLQCHADDAVIAPAGGLTAGDPHAALEVLMGYVAATNGGIYYYPDGGSTTVRGPYYLGEEQVDPQRWWRLTAKGGPLYRCNLRLRREA